MIKSQKKEENMKNIFTVLFLVALTAALTAGCATFSKNNLAAEQQQVAKEKTGNQKANEANTAQPAPTVAEEKSIWVGKDFGTGLMRNTLHLDFVFGGGPGLKIMSSTRQHDFVALSADGGWVLTDPIFPQKWYGGNLELMLKLMAGYQFNPNERYFIGLTPTLRYDFTYTGSRWMPFIGIGAGPSATNIEGPDLSGTFQFNIRICIGTYYFVTKDGNALIFYLDGFHISNAHLCEPNNGTNAVLFLVGYSFY